MVDVSVALATLARDFGIPSRRYPVASGGVPRATDP